MTRKAACRILFVSFKALLDRNSGAALELKTVIEALARDESNSAASVSLNCYDVGDSYRLDPRIASEMTDSCNVGRFYHFDDNCIRHYIQACPSMNTMNIGRQTYDLFLNNARKVISKFDPTVVIFFGSNEILPVIQFAKNRGTRVVLYTGTASYHEDRQPLFDIADEIVAPSDFIRELYEARFKKNVKVIPTSLPFAPPAINIEQKVARRETDFITIINPSTDKGGHVAFSIASHMREIRNFFLAVEGRATHKYWTEHGYDLSAISNLFWAPWQSDITRILSKTSILLIPSLIPEAAGKVISEAMALGVPVVGSEIGGIQQQLAGSGVTVSLKPSLLPNTLTNKYKVHLSAEDVEDWTSAIAAVLNSEDFYRSLVIKGLESCDRYKLENILPSWRSSLGIEMFDATV
ncbi:glycosyltransferase [Loktanella sp. 3ANDIMAR09]|uniref:glycosyltransferase n=1 Tax=Loktanella sp. 3ANDIMAR09 TaxID=1225657 RepID=UPI0009F93C4D|nr:glycosyltransferase [Loktanella sp. 3ANDIMAR09]